MRLRPSLLGTLCIVLSICTTHVSSAETHNAAWDALREGTAIAIMRHALAPGTSDPENFDVTDCATQRNLSHEGRSQASAIGEIFRRQRISEAQVISSQWCRCIDTAVLLGLGSVEVMPALNSFFDNRVATDSQTRAVRAALPGWMRAGSEPTVLVSHQVNISALTGSYTDSGEILIITLDGEDVVVMASIPTR